MIHTVRVYDKGEIRGKRFLVDRIWPRGIKKEQLQTDGWIKEAAPSTELRKWFSHDASRWDDFKDAYFHELDEKQDGWRVILDSARKGDVTLLYTAADRDYNNAIALQEYLQRKLAEKQEEK